MYSKPNLPISKSSARNSKTAKGEVERAASSKAKKAKKEESDNSEDEGPQIMLS